MSDLIDRQKLIEFLQARFKLYDWDDSGAEKAECGAIIREIYDFPSAEMQFFEWCHDCKEYDQEAHCCHRWSKVINETVPTVPEYVEHHKQIQEMMKNVEGWIEKLIEKKIDEPRWIPCSERLPKKGNTTYMTTLDYGKLGRATGQRFFYGKRIGWEDDAVVAWMPMIEPYKGEDNE